MLALTMLVPTQQLMLWCNNTMMDMETEMEMNHETMAMNMMDHDQAMTSEHCDSDSKESMSNTEDCDMMIDCNCMTIQGTTSDQAVLALVSVQVPMVTESVLFDLINPEITTQVPIPPPIWSFSSYSPPDLFLANASFLI